MMQHGPGTGEQPTSYDVVDYPGGPFSATHPASLAALGVLHGLQPAPVPQCRVLELGCGDAGNLVPMAYQLPDARFVGIDLASAAIARGRLLTAALQLDNLELHVMDICDPAADALGQFDYVIAHGVFSWVPEPVRARLLALCASLLAPQGIAFVSYLAQPGTQVRDVLRQCLLRHGSDSPDPAVRIARARELVSAIGGKLDSPDPFQQALRTAARELVGSADGALYHDWLAPINAPFRFLEFIEQAGRYGLAFLSEAEYFAMGWRHDPLLTEAYPLLAAAEERDVLLKEQLLDELRCRRFRQTLLCHADHPRTAPAAERVFRLAVSAHLRPVGDPDLATSAVAEFRSIHDIGVRVDHPVVKAALLQLYRNWPRAESVSALLAAARAACGRTDPATEAGDAEVLGSVLLTFAGTAHAELTAWSPPFVCSAGERPRASALARIQLAQGHKVTTLRHRQLEVRDALGVALLGLLDGTRTREQLVAELERLVVDGRLPPPPSEGATGDLRSRLADGLERSLTGLGRAALLEA